MQFASLAGKSLLGFLLLMMVFAVPAVEADDFTLGIKGFYPTRTTDNLDDDEGFFDPGIYFAWDINDRLWLSAGYVGGSVDFRFSDPAIQSAPGSTIEEIDSDLIIGWSLARIDLGLGYRYTEFTFETGGISTPVESAGPTVFIGGGDLFGPLTSWGYYWGAAYMFEDIEDDDGSQKHFNGEAGLRWTSDKNFSVLFGYRHKEYSGDGAGGLTFAGPVVNLSYTFRKN